MLTTEQEILIKLNACCEKAFTKKVEKPILKHENKNKCLVYLEILHRVKKMQEQLQIACQETALVICNNIYIHRAAIDGSKLQF